VRVIIDSTVLVSIFSDKDKFHRFGLDVFSNILDKKIEPVIPTFAVVETCGLIGRKFGQHLAAIVEDQLSTWVDNGMLLVKELTLDRMKYATEDAIRFGLKGADAVFVALTKEIGAKLITFDDKVEKKVAGKIGIYKIKVD